jgi:hypothetical protein
MHKNEGNGSQIAKNKPDDSSKPVTIDFGNRAIVDQNFSKVVSLPKIALQNCGNVTEINVKLVQGNGEKYLKLTPVQQNGGESS